MLMMRNTVQVKKRVKLEKQSFRVVKKKQAKLKQINKNH